jgi:hypothetical protein
MRRLLPVLPLVAVLAWTAAAHAIVPPRDCGRLSVSSRTYVVKADQLPCRDAKRYTSRYLGRSHVKPSGYTCRRYKASETALAFRCTRGIKTFFAIRR